MLATGVRQVLYPLPRPTLDGRTVLVLSPLEFLAALSRLIPPPRVHRHRYHGVLAPNARLHARVVALGRTEGEGDEPPDRSPALTPQTPRNVAARSRWARLLARIHEVFLLQCPACGADLRILAFLTEPEPVQAILRHLGLPATPPPLSPRTNLGATGLPGRSQSEVAPARAVLRAIHRLPAQLAMASGDGRQPGNYGAVLHPQSQRAGHCHLNCVTGGQ